MNFNLKKNFPETYIKGYTLIAKQEITKTDFIRFCNLLEDEYNLYYDTNQYSISPYSEDKRVDSGIVFNNFKNNENTGYKGMSILRLEEYYDENNKLVKQFKNIINANTTIVCGKNEILYTILKSFNRAPVYTIEELQLFEKCFNQIGIEVNSEYPKKENLNIGFVL